MLLMNLPPKTITIEYEPRTVLRRLGLDLLRSPYGLDETTLLRTTSDDDL